MIRHSALKIIITPYMDTETRVNLRIIGCRVQAVNAYRIFHSYGRVHLELNAPFFLYQTPPSLVDAVAWADRTFGAGVLIDEPFAFNPYTATIHALNSTPGRTHNRLGTTLSPNRVCMLLMLQTACVLRGAGAWFKMLISVWLSLSSRFTTEPGLKARNS